MTGGFFNTSWLASLALGPSKEERRKFQASSYSGAYSQPTQLPYPSSSGRSGEVEGSCCNPVATTATALDATPSVSGYCLAAPSALNCGSCLLFPAQAGGCLLVVSARPIGSTVRLRDPAKADRQGSHPQSCHGGRAAEREGMEWSFCHLPATVPAAWDLPTSLSATSESPGLSTSLSVTSPSMPGYSALAAALPHTLTITAH